MGYYIRLLSDRQDKLADTMHACSRVVFSFSLIFLLLGFAKVNPVLLVNVGAINGALSI